MKYLEKFKELKGKTIDKIVSTSGNLYIVFSDKSWTALKSTVDTYEYDLESPEIVNKSKISHNDEYYAGLITLEELKEIQKKQLLRQTINNKRREKLEYERLKKIFEK